VTESKDLLDPVEAAVADWLTVPDVAERLGVDVTRVRQLLRERHLLARRRGERNVLQVPAEFLDGAEVVKGLHGTLVVLADSGFSDDEAMRWLFADDDSLPGSPIAALRANRGTEVRRRAQALAF
jgi:hypothetical protein